MVRLRGISVPINNSWSDNQGKTGCQLPDFFSSQCEDAGYSLLQGRATLDFFSILFWWHIRPNHSLVPPRQSWWQTRIINNRLDILPKQHPLGGKPPNIRQCAYHIVFPLSWWWLTPLLTSVGSTPLMPQSWQYPENPGHLVSNTSSVTPQRLVVVWMERGIEPMKERLCLQRALNSCACTLIHMRQTKSKYQGALWEVISWKESARSHYWDKVSALLFTVSFYGVASDPLFGNDIGFI